LKQRVHGPGKREHPVMLLNNKSILHDAALIYLESERVPPMFPGCGQHNSGESGVEANFRRSF
jgi:hypothetical protein